MHELSNKNDELKEENDDIKEVLRRAFILVSKESIHPSEFNELLSLISSCYSAYVGTAVESSINELVQQYTNFTGTPNKKTIQEVLAQICDKKQNYYFDFFFRI